MGFKQWIPSKWGDLCTLEYGKGLKGYKESNGKIPVYGTNGLIGFTYSALCDRDGVIIGRKGAYRGVHYSSSPFFVIDTAFYLNIIDNDKLDMKFAYYNLLTKDINSMDSGSAIPSTSRSDFYSMESIIPPIEYQRAIAYILSTIDDKIENNNKINGKLQTISELLFKHWFIDFEFPNEEGLPYKTSGGEMTDSELGTIPMEWKVGCIGDYAKVKSGYAFKSVWWQNEGIPVIKIKDIENNTINFNGISYISRDKVAYAKDFIVKGGDLLIAMTGATLGKLAIVPQIKSDVLVNQRVGKFFLGDDPIKNLGFIYCILKREEIYNEIVSRGDGSAQPNISPSGIENIKIVMPPKTLISSFNNMLSYTFEKIIANTYENGVLVNLRNNLLPKLMNGEIDLSNIEIN